MYCEPCRVERLGTARFCVICGTKLQQRLREEVEADLAKVRWMLAELAEWDTTSVGPRSRQYVVDRYRAREKVLLSALEHQPAAQAEPLEPASFEPPPAPAPVPVPEAVPEPVIEPVPEPSFSAPAALLDAQPPTPSVEDKVVTEASTWSRVWKPFLNESIGWFIGAFLILTGTFYLVSDSWSGMTSTVRALVVFGLAAGWTLGFSAWAQFLWRRETTRGAARVLKLIGAAMAPLAPFAVGPVAMEHPLLTGVLVFAWCVVAAVLALGVTRDLQKVDLRNVPAAMGATAAMMGLAPWVSPLHGAGLWFNVIPVGLLLLNARGAARTQDATARLFAFLAPLFLAVLFGARLHYALLGDHLTWGTWAPFIALALTAALELRSPVGTDGRPHWERAADAISVLVVGGQLGLMAWALLGAAPAFFLTSAVGAHTCYRLLKASSSPLAPRWIYPTYFFSYFGWQTCGQLIPGALTVLLQRLKQSLGYAASGASLPYAYNAIYAAVFVVAGAALAVKLLAGKRRAWADPLLRSTWITSLMTVGLAISSLDVDTRPAMISLPLLLAMSLGLGLWLDRPAFTRTAAVTSFAFALTLTVWAGLPWSALPVALLAALLAALSVPFARAHRVALSWAGFGIAAIAVGLAWATPGNATQVVALAIAFGASWLIGRNLDLPLMQEAAWGVPAILVARAMVLWAPDSAAVGLAVSALTLAVIARGNNRLRHAEPASALVAVVAPIWQMVLQEPHGAAILLGPVLVLCAAALSLGAVRSGKAPTAPWRDALAILFATAAVLPGSQQYQMWPGWQPMPAAVLYAALGLASSVLSARFGRSWRPTWLGALVVVFTAVVCLLAEDRHQAPEWVAAVGAAGVLLTMRALLPSISVPLAALFAFRATDGNPEVMLGVAAGLSLLALFEEWDFTWETALGKRQVAWAASLSALVAVAALAVIVSGGNLRDRQVLVLLAAALPLVWVRATRSGVLAAAIAWLLYLGTWTGPKDPQAPWIVAGALLVLSHAVNWVRPLRALLFGKEDVERLKGAFAPWLLAGAAAMGVGLLRDGGNGLPWALLLVLAASELLAVRLAFATVFVLATPELAPIGAGVLVAIGFLERILPGVVSRLLGTKQHKWTVPTAAVGAICLAGFADATAYPGMVPGAWLLGATLLAGAVLLDQRWLFAAAVVAGAVPLATAASSQASIDLLVPRGGFIALGAAALAAVLRSTWLEDRLHAAFKRLNCPVDGELASPFWAGAAAVVSLAVALGGRHQPELALPLLATGALLLYSPHRLEVAGGAVLSVLVVFVVVPAPVSAAVLGGVGFTLCLAGMLLEGRHPTGSVRAASDQEAVARNRTFAGSAQAWHHAGWALSLVALTAGNSLHHPATAIAWGFAAGCAVVVAQRRPALEWIQWLGLAAGLHVALFFLGLKLSSGAPRELILPWVATASLVLAATAIKLAKAGRSGQRLVSAWSLVCLGMFELLCGLVLLHGGQAREAVVALAGILVALWALGGRIADDDDPIAAVLAGMLVPLGFVAVRRLAFGAGPDVVETLAALVAGAGVGGLARWLEDGKRVKSAQVARSFAFWWPLSGLLAAPWNTPWTICLLLLAQSAHFAVVARTGSMKRRAALLSTVAFNGAMAAAFFASDAGSPEYLLIPFGLSLLVLLKVFDSDLSEGTKVKLRAVSVTLVYAAAAAKPLTFDTTGALWLCVGLCVLGVAAGIVLRVRSYVYLGTAFMVTTLVVNLARYGVREPRMGALFLSGLGLAVVGFMVLVTTRRSELMARYQRARALLQRWEG